MLQIPILAIYFFRVVKVFLRVAKPILLLQTMNLEIL